MKNFNQNKITIYRLFTLSSWMSNDRVVWKIILPSSSEKKECCQINYKVRMKQMTTAKKYIAWYKP